MRFASKFNQSAIRLFFVILYGEHVYPWIRRHGYRFALDCKPTRLQFGCRNIRQAEEMFIHLQDLGWIYNYRRDISYFRFTLKPPHWLALSETAPLTERYVQWERTYDGDDSHITYDYIQSLSKTYKDRKASFDNLQQMGVDSEAEGPRTPEEILGE